jgi:hypothetical protein
MQTSTTHSHKTGKIYLGNLMESALGWTLSYSIIQTKSVAQSDGRTQHVQKQSVRIVLSNSNAYKTPLTETIDLLSKEVLAQKIEELSLA